MIQTLFAVGMFLLGLGIGWFLRRDLYPHIHSIESINVWIAAKQYKDRDYICSKIVSAALPGHSIYRTRPRKQPAPDPTKAFYGDPTAQEQIKKVYVDPPDGEKRKEMGNNDIFY